MNKVLMIATIAAILLGPIASSDTSKFAYAVAPLVIFPSNGAVGDLVSYSIPAPGDTPSTPYRITFDLTPVVGTGTIVASETTNSSGLAAGTFIVPAGLTVGSQHTISFTDGIAADTSTVPFIVLSSSSSSSSTLPSSVTIAGTCGLSIPTGTTINYGRLIPGSTSPGQRLIVTNTGTATASLLAFGSNWLDTTGTNQINVQNTQWSATGQPPFASLTSTPSTLTTAFAPGQLATAWQLVANLNSPTFVGSLTQSINLSVSC